jgi:RNA polymerase sigma-70 factor (ECF subfamily)
VGIKLQTETVISSGERIVRTGSRNRARQFEEVAIPFLADVYRLALKMSDENRASDLTQETFLRAWKYFDSFDRGTNCRAWLLRILHNVWVDQWRQPRLEIPLLENEEMRIEPYYDWEDEFIKGELSPALEIALRQLPEVYRWAVLLADVQELSYQEISRVMSCPIGTVMSRINRGRRTLASLLRDSSKAELTEVTSTD